MNHHSVPVTSAPAHTPRQSLSNYQRELAERTTLAAKSAALVPRQLGFMAAGCGWLINLNDAAEIMPVPAVTAVPGTQPWFLGLINYRGKLTGVVDFEHFLGQASLPPKTSSRLIVLSDRFAVTCALRVASVSGLMDPSIGLASDTQGNDSPLSQSSFDAKPGWQVPGMRIRNTEWYRLDVQALVSDSRFSDVAMK